MTSAWRAEHLHQIASDTAALIPQVDAPDRSGLDPARLYWDMWPLQDATGARAKLAGREVWMALTAPDRGDPALRHFEAKIHWIERRDGLWHDLGPVLPDLDVPYEREWAGSALLDAGVVTLFFTAAGTAAQAGAISSNCGRRARRWGRMAGRAHGPFLPLRARLWHRLHARRRASRRAGHDQGVPRSGFFP